VVCGWRHHQGYRSHRRLLQHYNLCLDLSFQDKDKDTEEGCASGTITETISKTISGTISGTVGGIADGSFGIVADEG
jgi:hypothetical protein